MSKIEVNQRRAVSAELKSYCYLSSDYDSIEVTQWSNHEGYDIVIERKNCVDRFSLSHGEWELLQVLINWKSE